jgi:hypothetical protein
MISVEVTERGKDPYSLTINSGAIRKWEKQTGKSYKDLSLDDFEDVYALVYYAAVRAGKFEGTLEEIEDAAAFEDAEVEQAPKASSQEV